MRSLLRISFLLFVTLYFSLICINISEADVNLPWSTTYNCPEWTQSQGNPTCDGLKKNGDWTCNGSEEQITSAANFPGGGGGRGQRQWNGDGINCVSGGTRVVFASIQPELWVRWYMRYEAGFKWSPLNYDKWLYFNPGEPRAVVPEWYGSDMVNIWVNYGGNHLSSSGNGWQTIMGGTTSDGQWHCYEIHIKMDTNGSNGIAEIWIDGVKRLGYTNVNFTTAAGWTWFEIGDNQRAPSNGRNMYVDFDDIAVNNTGYIGPIGNIPPSQPKNLRIQQ